MRQKVNNAVTGNWASQNMVVQLGWPRWPEKMERKGKGIEIRELR